MSTTTSAAQLPSTITVQRGHLLAVQLWMSSVTIAIAALAVAYALNRTHRAPIDKWLIISSISVGTFIPIALRLQLEMLRKYMRDGVVAPLLYLRMCGVLWAILVLMTILVAVTSILRQSVMPDMFVGLPVVMLLLLSWPSAWAMKPAKA